MWLVGYFVVITGCPPKGVANVVVVVFCCCTHICGPYIRTNI